MRSKKCIYRRMRYVSVVSQYKCVLLCLLYVYVIHIPDHAHRHVERDGDECGVQQEEVEEVDEPEGDHLIGQKSVYIGVCGMLVWLVSINVSIICVCDTHTSGFHRRYQISPTSLLIGQKSVYIGVCHMRYVSVVSQYKCVYYMCICVCDTHTGSSRGPVRGPVRGSKSVYIGVVSVVIQYKCVYYCDTYLSEGPCDADHGEQHDDAHDLVGALHLQAMCVSKKCMCVCHIYRRMSYVVCGMRYVSVVSQYMVYMVYKCVYYMCICVYVYVIHTWSAWS
jgi:hypothetical protein